MARLPQPGSDDGNWGAILNDYLLQAHKNDGTIKPGAVTTNAIIDDAVSEAKLTPAVRTKLDGVSGATGPQGPKGDDGAVGPQGPKGDDGADSTVAGPKGDTGATGADGADSTVAGPKGDKGDTGAAGADGADGADSTVPGPEGTKGEKGDTGAAGTTTWAGITDKPSSFTPAAHTHVAADISNSTAIGRSVLTAADAAAVRTVIGAGTGSSNLTIGTTSSTAKAGDYAPTKADVGLGDVDNTADADKPVSTAQESAIDAKYTKPGAGIPESDLSSDVQTKLSATGSPFVVVENVEDVPPGTAVGTVVVVTG